MFRTAYHTVAGGLRYVSLLNSENPPGEYASFPLPEIMHAAILPPGWLAPGCVMDMHAELLTHRGIPACTHHIGYEARGSYEFLLRRFEQRICRLREACPNLKRLDAVAHSMGGILAVDAINNGLFDGLRVRLVTLGTMHQGTWSALLGCPFSWSAFELLPVNSRFRNGAHAHRLDDVPFLSIAGKHDLVAPPARCRHPQAQFMELPADHGSLLTKRSVFKTVHRFLTHEMDHGPLRPL